MTPAAKQQVFRFAPSPNGLLHLGHANSALRNFEAAQKCGGRFLLRIEDIDPERSKPEFEAGIFEDLSKLGITWGGAGAPPVRAFWHLRAGAGQPGAARAGLPLFCSRGDIAAAVAGRADWPRDPDGAPLYPGTCRMLSAAGLAQRQGAGQLAAHRLNLSEALVQAGTRLGWTEFGTGASPRDVQAEPHLWGDAVIARKDVPASYHLAVVVDDAAQGVTDVMRGEDLFQATSLHRLLQVLLDLPAPAYHHHPLLLDAEGRKLSKSIGSQSVAALMASGASAADIRRMAFGIAA